MAENKDYVINAGADGSINISEDVIASIAGLAAKEVEGIAALAAPTGKDIADLLGKRQTALKNINKGVKITLNDKTVSVDMFVKITYGTKISDAASELQKAVESSIISMTGLSVANINVFVVGLDFSKTLQAEPQYEE